jgi:hypothetical protein
MNKKNKMGLILALAGLAGNVMAGTLTSFTPGDLLICFRNANDLVVDAGPVSGSTFVGSPIGSTNNITTYTAANLNGMTLNSASWSAVGWENDGTLYITKARQDKYNNGFGYPANYPNVQSAPWSPTSANPVGAFLNNLESMVNGAVNCKAAPFSSGKTQSTTAVYTPPSATGQIRTFGSGLSYGDVINPLGVNGNPNFEFFQGDPEFDNLSSFVIDNLVARSDLYKISADGSTVTWLGYLELNPSTSLMTFVHAPDTTPVITKITRAGGVTTILYTTGVNGTYTLLATNSAGLTAPKSTWPVVATLTSGDLLTHTNTDTDTTSTNKFYIISGQ